MSTSRDPSTPQEASRARSAFTTTLDARNRWLVLAGLALLGFVLGYLGLRRIAIDQHGDSSVLTLIYQDFALVSFSSGNAGSGTAIPWTYQVARFLLPFVVIYGAFAGLVMLFRDRFQQVRLPFVRRHAVVVGLGEMGLAFAEAMRRGGDRVVVVERDAAHSGIAVARAEGIIVVVGDARERGVLAAARIHRARHLIATADDAVNLEVLVVARQFVAGHPGAPLDCLVHSTDAEVCALLKQQMLESVTDGRIRVDFFNYYDQAARLLLRTEPPDADVVVVMGQGMLADAVVRTASRMLAGEADRGSGPLLLVAPDASVRVGALVARGSASSRRVDLGAIDRVLDPTSIDTPPLLPADSGRARVYVCDERGDVNLALALALRNVVRASHSRVIVCSDHVDGLSLLFASEASTGGDVHVVRLGAQICTREFVDEGIFEMIARATHAAYIRSRKLEGDTSILDESLRPWAQLPETLRASNRDQAAHVGTKLAAIGCGLVPLDGAAGQWFVFTSDEIERLAEMEHERWVTERASDGWRPGPERDPLRKRTPYLVDWDDLPEDIRDRDRETIVQLPARLGDAGYEIIRLVPDGRPSTPADASTA